MLSLSLTNVTVSLVTNVSGVHFRFSAGSVGVTGLSPRLSCQRSRCRVNPIGDEWLDRVRNGSSAVRSDERFDGRVICLARDAELMAIKRAITLWLLWRNSILTSELGMLLLSLQWRVTVSCSRIWKGCCGTSLSINRTGGSESPSETSSINSSFPWHHYFD